MNVRNILGILCLCFVTGCETAPSVISVQAVKAQNQITRQHIGKAREHISAAQKAQAEEQNHVQSALNDLNQLLQPTPTPTPRSRKKR